MYARILEPCLLSRIKPMFVYRLIKGGVATPFTDYH